MREKKNPIKDKCPGCLLDRLEYTYFDVEHGIGPQTEYQITLFKTVNVWLIIWKNSGI